MNVKELRRKSGLTQDELSVKTGIPRDRIAKWEQGKGSPKSADEKKLELVFGKSWQEQLPQNGTTALNKAQETPKSQNQGLDLISEVTRLMGDYVTLKATLKVIISEIVPLIAKATGRSHASVSAQMEKDISAEISNLKTLDRKQSGD